MSHSYLPPTLTLFPLPKPYVLYPYLQVAIQLSTPLLCHLIGTFQDNQAKVQSNTGISKSSENSMRDRFVAAVPVTDGDRRVGRWACAAKIKRIERDRGDPDLWTIVLEGLARVHLPRSLPPVLSILPPLSLPITSFSLPLTSPPNSPPDLIPLASKMLAPEINARIAALPPTIQADLLATILAFEWDTRVEILSTPDIDDRCALVHQIMLSLNPKKDSTSPRRIIPGPSSALVRRSPGPPADPPTHALPEDLQSLQATMVARQNELSPAAHQACLREIARLSKLPPQAAEYGVGKTYVEWLLSLPWRRVSPDTRLDLNIAKRQLEDEHEGLHEVKRRVVEYLAVFRLKRDLWEENRRVDDEERSTRQSLKASDAEHAIAEPSSSDIPTSARSSMNTSSIQNLTDDPPNDVFRDKAPILLLVGPPGVGKTSIARSLAGALGRKFHRISLGGVRDEAEIRGHRRTYVGALPGLFVQGFRKVGVSNSVILLDELDKIGTSNYHGDPGAALLETLDPAQNWAFHDHYLGDVPIDLSQVTFIATANTLDTISPPLLDRCEVIECPGYITDEKLAIARKFLLPKQTVENGLSHGAVKATDDVLERVVADYTREAGVRSLEREIAKLCRAKAVQFSASRDGGDSYDPVIKLNDLERILGMAKYERELREEINRPGVVTGLAYRGSGNGGILLVETTIVPGGKGRLQLTGSLGDVIRESAELALAWVKANAIALGIGPDPLSGVDVHLHLPAGAVKKDGPSAGVAILIALVSLLTDRPVPPTLALTGEVTLRGAVTAVGGIREKVLGAHRAGITRVIMPAQNEKDTHDLPPSTSSMTISYIRTVEAALESIWGSGVWADIPRRSVGREARL